MVYWCKDIVKKLKGNKAAVFDEGRYILDEPLMLTEDFEIIGIGRVVIEGKIQVYSSDTLEISAMKVADTKTIIYTK